MNIKTKCLTIFLILFLAYTLNTGNLSALSVNLNSFIAPFGNVDISSDGLFAILKEDISGINAPISLEKLDFFIPTDALSLNFDYELIVPVYNEDYFDFLVNNLYELEIGGFDPTYSETLTYSGTFNYDLTALRGETVPIIFDINYGWEDFGFDSYVTVSNVNLNTLPTPIPEPSTGFLLATSLISLIGLKRKKFSI